MSIANEVNLYVDAAFPGNEVVRVGRLLSRNLSRPGEFEGFFRYDKSYLDHPFAYPVDPVHLPLKDRVFNANRPETGLHAVFEDSLPDAWGRQILAWKGKLTGRQFAPPHLLAALGGAGLGRLIFSTHDREGRLTDASVSFRSITEALEEAEHFERGDYANPLQLRRLLACGSSAGGARPKVLVKKDDGLWIAKLASVKDLLPGLAVALEEAGLLLAARAGVETPERQRVKIGNRELLLVRRFDVTEGGGRNALVSLRTLVAVEDQDSLSYADLAKVIARVSAQPGVDLERLFRQMAVNVLLFNTDDHLQNFTMLHTEQGWRLSPAYDIVPNLFQAGQILMVNQKHEDIGADDVISEGNRFGLSRVRGKRLLAVAIDALGGWPEVFDRCGVPEAHTAGVRQRIGRRLAEFEQGAR